ncbi:DUF1501 domain-containing protein [Croceiramulus getboli]|nr:DUF1501 domain-containing protein [Flavobacteriaceae bacterium YJPT1-3]
MCNHDIPHNHPLSNRNKKEKQPTKQPYHKTAAHHEEHERWSRRTFMQALGLAGTGTMMLGGTHLMASQPSKLNMALTQSDNDNILVLVRLKGGNDGLNTIVPVYDYDYYSQQRPGIRISDRDFLPLNADFAIPPSMEDAYGMWGEGAMKVVHGVGYSVQNLSHFTSSDIWATADHEQEVPTGVFGRYFDQLYPDFLVNPPEEPAAVQIGSIGNLIFEGEDSNFAFTVSNPDQLAEIATTGVLHDVLNVPDCTYGEQLAFMRGMINTTFKYAGVINEAYEASTNAVEYSNDQLGKQLAIVARMIKGGLGTKVILVTLGGFDTHANQTLRHQELLTELSSQIKLFYDDLTASGMQERVLTMTFSEFGRRIFENGSDGTDHGAASPVLFFGPALQGNGFFGTHPDLRDPEGPGNLKHSTDFRSVYATVLKEWLCIDGALVDSVLLNNYENIPLGFACGSLGLGDNPLVNSFFHVPVYQGKEVFIEFKLPASGRVVVKLYNMLGQEVSTLADSMMFDGQQKINVRQQVQGRLAIGQYIYRISTGGQNYSKSIVIS